MKAKKFFSVFLVAVMVASVFCTLTDGEASAESVYAGDFLLDRGNGDTVWMRIETGSTNAEVIINSLTASGIECSYVGSVLEIEGKSETVIGAADTGGTFIKTGTTGVTTVSTWKVFIWDDAAKEWSPSTPDTAYGNGPIAVAFYPDGLLPIETPEYKSSWTMIYADANNSGNQVAEITEEKKTYWSSVGDDVASGCYSNALYARGHAFIKFGMSKAGSSNGSVVSFNAITGEKEWTFTYPIQMIEMSCIALMGQYIFIQSSDGHIYRFEWAIGPGNNNENVTSFDGLPYGSDKAIPYWTEWSLIAGGTVTSATLDQNCLIEDVNHHYSTLVLKDTQSAYDAMVAASASIEGSIAEGDVVYKKLDITTDNGVSITGYGANIEKDHYLMKYLMYYNGIIIKCTDDVFYQKGDLKELDAISTVKSIGKYLKKYNDECGQDAEAIAEKIVNKMPGTGANLVSTASYGVGPYSMVADSGSLFMKCSSGMTYCFDRNLSLQWSYQMLGGCYVTAVTVTDGYVGAGAYDGCLYILDKTNGSLICKQTVFWENGHGTVNTPIFVKTTTGYKVFVSYSDGLIMLSELSGLAVYDFDGTAMTLVKDLKKSIGSVTSYLTRYVSNDFAGVIASSQNGLYKIDGSGNATRITNLMKGSMAPHSSPTLINGKYLYSSTYGKYKVYCFDLDGNVIGEYDEPIQNYSMACVTVVDNIVFHCNDEGISVITSTFPEYVDPTTVPEEMPLWQKLGIIVLVIIAIVVVIWLILRFAFKMEHPFSDLKERIYIYFYGENYSHNTKSKRRLYAVILLGLIALICVSLLSMCVGNKTSMSIGEAVSALVSSLQKGGQGLNNNEYLIYVDRMPRIIAAIGAGIGLSIAGAMYQAVIKNPLVEPYIMGVSSGAGTLAIAVIAFDFTFFGLFAANSPYLTAICAIVGGLLAFGITMFLAVKTGGKSINFVLSGIVIGLVFSAVQSLMIIMAGHKITDALSWLYGSFVSITWEEAWLILIPSITLSLIPIIWAKELNLILLGDDQAKQMGLNVERFNKFILISASILTAFCVAFCGIIGFVGLVIPHLSRMIMGGDHRMMLPVSMALGGSLMVLSDLLARMLLSGFELPVGAVTTVIGIPVFAYLLIKRGRSYDA